MVALAAAREERVAVGGEERGRGEDGRIAAPAGGLDDRPDRRVVARQEAVEQVPSVRRCHGATIPTGADAALTAP